MLGFKTVNLPIKNYTDFAMSSDGKCITIVCGLSEQGSSEQYIRNFQRNFTEKFKLYSSYLSGSLDRRNFIKNQAIQLTNYIYSGNFFSDGSVFSSWDYGNTWYRNSGIKPKNWMSVDMSSDGSVQTLVGRGIYRNFFDVDVVENTPTHLYVSYDSGRTWNAKCSSRIWNAATISPNGKIILASDTYMIDGISNPTFSGPEFLDNNILISKDSGNGWEIAYDAPLQNFFLKTDYPYYSRLSFSESDYIKGVSYKKFGYFGRKQAKLSNDGRYQLIASTNGVILNTGYGLYEHTNINPSFLHGQVVIEQFGTGSESIFSGKYYSKLMPNCVDMSADGRYQIIAGQGFKNISGFNEVNLKNAYNTKNPWLYGLQYGDFFNPDVYISDSYGKNWSPISTLPSGLFCLSVSINSNLKNIAILGIPNSKVFPFQEFDYSVRRYGSDLKYKDITNYLSGVKPDSDLILIHSNNSGQTWVQKDLEIEGASGLLGRSPFLSQSVIGYMYEDNYLYPESFIYNYPEVKYINNDSHLDCLHSRIKLSTNGTRTGILKNGRLFLSNSFPTTSLQIPTASLVTPISGKHNWSLLRSGISNIKDIKINGDDGRYITYIVNTGHIQEQNLGNFFDFILYSGNVSGIPHGISTDRFLAFDSYMGGVILSSQNSGITWQAFQTPSYIGRFNPYFNSYGSFDYAGTGYYPNGLSAIGMSSDGKHQVIFSDGFFKSGQDEKITHTDLALDLYKSSFYTTYYISNDYGNTWSAKYIKSSNFGLNPTNIEISPDGGTIYFIGYNQIDVEFSGIDARMAYQRPDMSYIRNVNLLPFNKNFFDNKISYSLTGVFGNGNAIYISTDSGNSWEKKSLVSKITYSGNSRYDYTCKFDSDIYSALVSSVPSKYFSLEALNKNYFIQKFNSISSSNWNTGSFPQKAKNFIPVESLFANDINQTGLNGELYNFNNPYSNGYFTFNHISNSWSYDIATYNGYTDRPSELSHITNIPSTLQFQTLKASSEDNSVLVGITKNQATYSVDKPLGGILFDIEKSEINSIYISKNNGATWEPKASLSRIGDLNISSDGANISFLALDDSAFKIKSIYNNIYNASYPLDEGARYGIPYVSNNSGSSFYPILKWEMDLDRRRCSIINIEKSSDLENSATIFDINGASSSEVLNNSYNLFGYEELVVTGFTNKKAFYPAGFSGMSFNDFLSSYDNSNCLISKYSGSNFYTSGYINTNLYRLSSSSNGKYSVIVENGFLVTEFTTGNERQLRINTNNNGSGFIVSLNNKIYLNDQSGFYINNINSNKYITGAIYSGQQDIFPFTGKIFLPDKINFNTGLDQLGVLIADDNKQLYWSPATASFPGKISTVCDNQVIFTQVGIPIYSNKSEDTYSYQYYFDSASYKIDGILKSGSNLYIKEGSAPFAFSLITGNGVGLPSGLGMSDYNIITGTPLKTGFYLCGITISGVDDVISKNYWRIFVGSGSGNYITEDLDVKSIYSYYPSGGRNLYAAKIKLANFYRDLDTSLYSYNFSGMTGWGPIKLTAPSGLIASGIITSPTGKFNAISYETGVLRGTVLEDSSSFTWDAINIAGTGSSKQVFYDHELYRTQSSNIIYIDKTKLVEGDLLNINNVIFVYRDNQDLADADFFGFHDLDLFATYELPIAGVTGYIKNTNELHMFSYPLDGEEANQYFVSRDTEDLTSIVIPNRYFTGGRSIRDSLSSWRGDIFTGFFPIITRENSGIYSYYEINQIDVDNAIGTAWDSSPSKTYRIVTGIYNQLYPSEYSGVPVNYISGMNLFSGNGIIPSGQDRYWTGIKFNIIRDKFNNTDSGIAKYVISGSKDILYSGYINV